eukprot:2547409-Rhodomonas_salina.1
MRAFALLRHQVPFSSAVLRLVVARTGTSWLGAGLGMDQTRWQHKLKTTTSTPISLAESVDSVGAASERTECDFAFGIPLVLTQINMHTVCCCSGELMGPIWA